MLFEILTLYSLSTWQNSGPMHGCGTAIWETIFQRVYSECDWRGALVDHQPAITQIIMNHVDKIRLVYLGSKVHGTRAHLDRLSGEVGAIYEEAKSEPARNWWFLVYIQRPRW